MEIVKYHPAIHKEDWNKFVPESRNGTFLHDRNFMDYHSDRFSDYSFLFYDKGKLAAVLPANISGKCLYSHQGLTYGGLITNHDTRTTEVLDIFQLLISYLQTEGVSQIIYKSVPHIYHKYPAEEDLYALFQHNAELKSRSVSSTVALSGKMPSFSQLRKRQIKKAKQQEIIIQESDGLEDFWAILHANLQEKHNTLPVHTLEEIDSLKRKFPRQIRLFEAKKDNATIAGCLVFETETVAHVQYISANDYGKQYGALDLLFDILINEIFTHKNCFDFGISTENEGTYLNEGLISQKEGFGARATIYDTYILNI